VAPNASEKFGQATGQVDASALDTNQPDTAAVSVGLGDLVRDASEAALYRIGIEEQFSVSHGMNCGHKKTNLLRAHRSASYNVVSSVFRMSLGDLAGSL